MLKFIGSRWKHFKFNNLRLLHSSSSSTQTDSLFLRISKAGDTIIPIPCILNQWIQEGKDGNLSIHYSMDVLEAAELSYDYDEGPKLAITILGQKFKKEYAKSLAHMTVSGCLYVCRNGCLHAILVEM
ncbi:hypothetical protein RYX36_037245, partial [Vicia faba]